MEFEITHTIKPSEIRWKGIIIHKAERQRYPFPPQGEPFTFLADDGQTYQVSLDKQNRIRMPQYFKNADPSDGDTVTFRFRVDNGEDGAKQTTPTDQIRDLLIRVASVYPEARKTKYPGDGSIRRTVENELPKALKSVILFREPNNWKLEGSVGKGNWALVPWVAALRKDITESVSEGFYIVYLFCADGSGAYLVLMLGTGGVNRAAPGDAENKVRDSVLSQIAMNKSSQALRQQLAGFKTGTLPNGALKAADNQRASAYEKACIIWKYYGIENLRSMADAGQLKRNLQGLVDAYAGIHLTEGDSKPPKQTWMFQCNPDYFDLRGALRNMETKGLSKTAHTVHQHREDIHAGDTVYMWEAGPKAGILAVGRILADPHDMPLDKNDNPFLKQPERYAGMKPRVPIRIDTVLKEPILKADLVNDPILSSLSIIRQPQGTNFLITPGQADALASLLERRGLVQAPYTIDDLVAETGFTRNEVASWRRKLERKKHIVFQGPPGTGKTFVAERLAKLMTSGSEGIWEVVQFHPAYAYEDFIQGIRPRIVDGSMTFELESGRFLEFCTKAAALEESGTACVMIIDEINRAHLSRVFGELMYLLEYRHKKIPLAAGGEPFRIPSNVYLIGTMNTADRSIALVDHALRRRFSFIRLKPDFGVLRRHMETRGHDAASLISVLHRINTAIGDPNYEVGISFFMREDDRLPEYLPDIWTSEIEPYLEEFFYDQPGKVDPFRWDRLVSNELAAWG